MNPYYEKSGVVLYHGDCLEVVPALGLSFDACISDPPYGTTACAWDAVIPFKDMWRMLSCVKEGGAIALFGAEPFSSYLRISNIRRFRYDWVWEKSKSGSAFTAKYRPVNKHEMISVFGDGVLKYHPQMTAGNPYARTHHARDDAKNNHRIGMNVKSVRTCNDGFRYPITVQRFQQRWRRQDQCHPTQKPVELMEYLIRTYTDEGDLVLDFAAGSGTTGVAALMTGRRCVLVEKEERYCEVAARRIEAASESPADLF